MTDTDKRGAKEFYPGSRDDLVPGDCFRHGTRAGMSPRELLKPGHPANFGKTEQVAKLRLFHGDIGRGAPTDIIGRNKAGDELTGADN